jgi:hypothetical protein
MKQSRVPAGLQRTHTYLSKRIAIQLRSFASAQRVSMSAVVEQALRDFFADGGDAELRATLRRVRPPRKT